MKYTQKSFTVPASSEKSPPDCRHGWLDAHGKCVLCGDVKPVKPERKRFPPVDGPKNLACLDRGGDPRTIRWGSDGN